MRQALGVQAGAVASLLRANTPMWVPLNSLRLRGTVTLRLCRLGLVACSAS